MGQKNGVGEGVHLALCAGANPTSAIRRFFHTAGRDLSIGEFEEVGNAVKEFAAEDATVVIGTVIEPEMHGEMRVTVVATGLGLGQKRQQPYKVVKTGTGPADYEQLDIPTVVRNRRTEARAAAPAPEGGMEYLDIPAFLRKQAD